MRAARTTRTGRGSPDTALRTWSTDRSTGISFQGILTHELGHALAGVGHTTCPGTMEATAWGAGQPNRILYSEDQLAIRGAIGFTWDTPKISESSDGLNWGPKVNASANPWAGSHPSSTTLYGAFPPAVAGLPSWSNERVQTTTLLVDYAERFRSVGDVGGWFPLPSTTGDFNGSTLAVSWFGEVRGRDRILLRSGTVPKRHEWLPPVSCVRRRQRDAHGWLVHTNYRCRDWRGAQSPVQSGVR